MNFNIFAVNSKIYICEKWFIHELGNTYSQKFFIGKIPFLLTILQKFVLIAFSLLSETNWFPVFCQYLA